MNVEGYLRRCEIGDEMRSFLKENPMYFHELVDYARVHNMREWSRALCSVRFVRMISRYCKRG